jgi:MYXO-CTERM domain-containing protein
MTTPDAGSGADASDGDGGVAPPDAGTPTPDAGEVDAAPRRDAGATAGGESSGSGCSCRVAPTEGRGAGAWPMLIVLAAAGRRLLRRGRRAS